MFKIIAIAIIPLFLFSISDNFVLSNDSIILEKTVEKINSIGKELRDKTNISIYVSLNEKALGKDIKSHAKAISNGVDGLSGKDYALIAVALDIQKIDILSSNNIKHLIDKDKILDDYIIPFFVNKNKNTQMSKYSAGILNGYSQLAEDIADSKNITLKNAIYSNSKDFFDLFKILIYSIFLIAIVAFLYMKGRK